MREKRKFFFLGGPRSKKSGNCSPVGIFTARPGMFLNPSLVPTGGDWISGFLYGFLAFKPKKVETPAPVNPSYARRDARGQHVRENRVLPHGTHVSVARVSRTFRLSAASRRATCVLPAIIWANRERCGSCESCVRRKQRPSAGSSRSPATGRVQRRR